jgi:UDP-galactopyranose mutase
MQSEKILVVGAGFSGATVARYLAEAGYKTIVIDQRNHVAGNAYDYINEYGHNVHAYGPHIFHTNNADVVDWLSRFTKWINYKHKVRAKLSPEKYVTLPPNRETLKILGSEQAIINTLFRPYTRKMWGMELEDLNPDIINRVPIRNDMNEYYFPSDHFQMMPENGYTKLVTNILSHPNISTQLNTTYEQVSGLDFLHTFNSMPIDEYYRYEHGELPYRSIKFHHKVLPIKNYQDLPTINLTDDGPITRVTEWKNYPNGGSQDNYFTSLTFEEPCCYRNNSYERYYPIKDATGRNRDIYSRYSAINNDKMTFIGRCGLYVYIDMHQAISSSISIARKFLKGGLHD